MVDPGLLARIGWDSSSLTAAGFKELLHPRDIDGRFLSKGDIVHVPASPRQGAFKVTHVHDDGAVNIKNLGNGLIDHRIGSEYLRRGEAPDGTVHDQPPPKPMDLSKPNAKMDEQDKYAVYDYAWDLRSYHDINGGMRAGKSIDQLGGDGPQGKLTRDIATRLERLTNEGRIDRDLKLYRTINDVPGLINSLKPGQVFSDPGFMSTSHRQDKADEMLVGEIDESAVFEITAPAGSRGLVLGDALSDKFPAAYDQGEVILPPGTRLRIDSVGPGTSTMFDPVDYPGFKTIKATVV